MRSRFGVLVVASHCVRLLRRILRRFLRRVFVRLDSPLEIGIGHLPVMAMGHQR